MVIRQGLAHTCKQASEPGSVLIIDETVIEDAQGLMHPQSCYQAVLFNDRAGPGQPLHSHGSHMSGTAIKCDKHNKVQQALRLYIMRAKASTPCLLNLCPTGHGAWQFSMLARRV